MKHFARWREVSSNRSWDVARSNLRRRVTQEQRRHVMTRNPNETEGVDRRGRCAFRHLSIAWSKRWAARNKSMTPCTSLERYFVARKSVPVTAKSCNANATSLFYSFFDDGIRGIACDERCYYLPMNTSDLWINHVFARINAWHRCNNRQLALQSEKEGSVSSD